MNRQTHIHIKKKTAVLVLLYLAAAVLIFGLLAGLNYLRAKRSELALSANYAHAFGELVTAVTELDTALEKSVYATSPDMAGSLCTEVFGKAMTAQMSLSALPYDTQELEQLSGFISRVGDYAYTLSRCASAAGGTYTEEQLGSLYALSEAAGTLALNLKSLRSEVQEGTLLLTAPTSAAAAIDAALPDDPGTLHDSLRLIEREFPEIPSLVYDGPFSEHLIGAAPKALEGLAEVSEDTAWDTAADFLGIGKGMVRVLDACGGDIPCYCFASERDGGSAAYVSVTKQGGKVLSMLCSRPVGSAAVDAETAVAEAERFLRANGYTDMAETYHMTQNGVLTVNFAYRQGDVLCYSDLVKVSVALDNGRVCGFEAGGYLSSHCVRELPGEIISAEEARAAVPEKLEILAEQTALVPSEGKYETLCREFKCQAETDRHYIIYVDAQTGQQHKILILLEDESGALTM